MAKFSATTTKPHPPVGPTRTTVPAPTHEGGAGQQKDPFTALYTLGLSNLVSEPTFYEAAEDRDERFRGLVVEVTNLDPAWMQAFIPWLRDVANMRTAPLVAALEYAAAGGPHARRVIDSAMRRADEPAEALGYWLHRYGRRLPMAVKRGIADAAVRLYNQNAAIKYDGSHRGVRMGDVIELCHPNPKACAAEDEEAVNAEVSHRLSEFGFHSADQAFSVRCDVMREAEASGEERVARKSALFWHLLNRRHGSFDPSDEAIADLHGYGLYRLAATYELDSVPPEQRRQILSDRGPESLAEAGFTWERLSGWLPGGMDAQAWEAIIPSMGYMARLRNLRNFEKAGVDRKVLQVVADELADPAAVAESRQFPYRFLSAYLNSGTVFFADALEDALGASLQNIPLMPGRTLVLADCSASMMQPLSARSAVRLCDIAALFGTAVVATSKVDFAIYATGNRRLRDLPRSVLRSVELVHNHIGVVGYGTATWPSLLEQYDGQDRVVVFTDSQDHPGASDLYLPDVPIYVWDVAGYSNTNLNLNQPNRYLFSGFSDSAFRLIGLLEAGHDAGWPWEA